MEYGATMQRADAENGVGSLVIEAPQSVNVRQIVEAYEEYNPDSELVAKRELERPVKTAAEFRSSLEEQLTDRQTAAITAAYFSGYYEWPRESTGEEIAESMDISSATLHQHIRSAHKEFLTAFLENGTQSPTDPI
jgi:predicted DNA binding protein